LTPPCETAPCGHIEDVPKEPEKDSNDGDPDSDPDSDPDPDPDPESHHEPECNEGNLIKNLSEAIKSLTESIHKDLSK